MPDETPAAWELHRAIEQIRSDQRAGFEGLNARLDKLVTTEAFEAERRRVDEKFVAVAEDIAQERGERKALGKDMQTAIDKAGAWVKWLIAGIALPVALFIFNLLGGAQ